MLAIPALRRRFEKRSLRRVLVVYLMIACLLPLIFMFALTYSSIYSILFGKIQSGILSSLTQEASSLENTINNLDFASKQFALDGRIVDEVSAFLDEPRIYTKSQIMESINEKINLVNFTNPYLGLTAYILPGADDPILFSNLTMDRRFDTSSLPRFIEYNGAVYFGPHRTLYTNSSNMVFSEQRIVHVQGDEVLYIYLESNYDLFRKILGQQTYGMPVTHLLVNEQGGTSFIENNAIPGNVLAAVQTHDRETHFEAGGYHLFRYASPQGWQLLAAVKKSDFDSEIRTWLLKMFILALATLAFAIGLAFLIWKQVYRPLRKVNAEIVRMAENRTTPVAYTQVEEFDFVLSNFQKMKIMINSLILDVEEKEKQKRKFEIEKLLSQINPHFLHNTLNTVQWLARMNGQKEIDKLVTLLVKVLHYNLGKQSLIVTARDELEAMRNYMELQRIRYDYEFEFIVSAEEETLSVAVPRFLLQPLVENAIYHGMSERNGPIRITIASWGSSHALFQVEDNGAGLDAKKMERLLSDEDADSRRKGMGIGLSYVHRMLRRYYGDDMTFSIDSQPGAGTKVSIVIPKLTIEQLEE